MKKESTNLEVPGKGKRFSAYILDLLINITVIGFIINLIKILVKKTTLGNSIIGIKALNINNKAISLGQSTLRYFIFYQTLPLLIFFLEIFYTLIRMFNHICIGSGDNGTDFCGHNTIGVILSYVLCVLAILCTSINIIEIFSKCPTFIDKRLGIKRIYKESKNNE